MKSPMVLSIPSLASKTVALANRRDVSALVTNLRSDAAPRSLEVTIAGDRSAVARLLNNNFTVQGIEDSVRLTLTGNSSVIASVLNTLKIHGEDSSRVTLKGDAPPNR